MNSRVARVTLGFSMRRSLTDFAPDLPSLGRPQCGNVSWPTVPRERHGDMAEMQQLGADYTRAIAARLSAGRRQHGADSPRIVKPQLHHFRRTQYRARLVLGLLPFCFGHRVVNNAGADLNVKHSLLQ